MSDDKAYKDGDIVWVKLGNSWWPGEVAGAHRQPDGLRHLKRKPYCVVKFFQEDAYEYVKSVKQIHPFQCKMKHEFIQKGLALHNAKKKFMEKFPSDVEVAERLSRKAIEASDTLIINDRPDSIVKAILGQTLTRRSNEYYGHDYTINGSSGGHIYHNNSNTRRSGDSVTKILNITPHRTNVSLNTTFDSGPNDSTVDRSTTYNTSVVVNSSSSSASYSSTTPTTNTNGNSVNAKNVYRCNLCDFTSLRQNVIIFHRKSHSNAGTAPTSAITAPAPTPSPKKSIAATKLPAKRVETVASAFSPTSKAPKVPFVAPAAVFPTAAIAANPPLSASLNLSATQTLEERFDCTDITLPATAATLRRTDNKNATIVNQGATAGAAVDALTSDRMELTAACPITHTPMARLPKKKELASLAMSVATSSKRVLRSSPKLAVDQIEITPITHNSKKASASSIATVGSPQTATTSTSVDTITSSSATNSTTSNMCNSEEIRLRLLADWSDEEKEEEEQSLTSDAIIAPAVIATMTETPETSPIVVEPPHFTQPKPVDVDLVDVDDEAETTAALVALSTADDVVPKAIPPVTNVTPITKSKRIRNIPKKDRRDVVLKEFSNELLTSASNSSTASATSITPPIVNLDSGSSSSSDSVVVIGETPPQAPNVAETVDVDQLTSDTESKVIEETTEMIEIADELHLTKVVEPAEVVESTAILPLVEAANEFNDIEMQQMSVVTSNLDPNISVITTTPNALPNTNAPTTLSCFDFQEDEEEHENEVLTSIANFKKKYYSPDKPTTDNKTMEATPNGQEDTKTEKYQQLTDEIETLLEQTNVPVLGEINLPMSSKEEASVKTLPIKERGKRIFKSRNRSRIEEISDLRTTTLEGSNYVNLPELGQDGAEADITDTAFEVTAGPNSLAEQIKNAEQQDMIDEDSPMSDKENLVLESENSESLLQKQTEERISPENCSNQVTEEITQQVLSIEENFGLEIGLDNVTKVVKDKEANNIEGESDQKSPSFLAHTNGENNTLENAVENLSSNAEEEPIIPLIKHAPVELYRHDSIEDTVTGVASGEDLETLEELTPREFAPIDANEQNISVGETHSGDLKHLEQGITENSSRLNTPTDENSSAGISETGAEFGSPTSMLDDERLSLVEGGRLLTPEAEGTQKEHQELAEKPQEESQEVEKQENYEVKETEQTIEMKTTSDHEEVEKSLTETLVNKEKQTIEEVKSVDTLEAFSNNSDFEIEANTEQLVSDDRVIRTPEITLERQINTPEVIVPHIEVSFEPETPSLTSETPKPIELFATHLMPLQKQSIDDEEIESPPHEALSGNEIEMEIVKVKRAKLKGKRKITKNSRQTRRKSDEEVESKESNTEPKEETEKVAKSVKKKDTEQELDEEQQKKIVVPIVPEIGSEKELDILAFENETPVRKRQTRASKALQKEKASKEKGIKVMKEKEITEKQQEKEINVKEKEKQVEEKKTNKELNEMEKEIKEQEWDREREAKTETEISNNEKENPMENDDTEKKTNNDKILKVNEPENWLDNSPIVTKESPKNKKSTIRKNTRKTKSPMPPTDLETEMAMPTQISTFQLTKDPLPIHESTSTLKDETKNSQKELTDELILPTEEKVTDEVYTLPQEENKLDTTLNKAPNPVKVDLNIEELSPALVSSPLISPQIGELGMVEEPLSPLPVCALTEAEKTATRRRPRMKMRPRRDEITVVAAVKEESKNKGFETSKQEKDGIEPTSKIKRLDLQQEKVIENTEKLIPITTTTHEDNKNNVESVQAAEEVSKLPDARQHQIKLPAEGEIKSKIKKTKAVLEKGKSPNLKPLQSGALSLQKTESLHQKTTLQKQKEATVTVDNITTFAAKSPTALKTENNAVPTSTSTSTLKSSSNASTLAEMRSFRPRHVRDMAASTATTSTATYKERIQQKVTENTKALANEGCMSNTPKTSSTKRKTSIQKEHKLTLSSGYLSPTVSPSSPLAHTNKLPPFQTSTSIGPKSSSPVEKVRINVDVTNPLSLQIANFLGQNCNQTQPQQQQHQHQQQKQKHQKLLVRQQQQQKQQQAHKSVALPTTLKRKKSIEDDIPSFIIERPSAAALQEVEAAILSGVENDSASHVQHMYPQVKITRKDNLAEAKQLQQQQQQQQQTTLHQVMPVSQQLLLGAAAELLGSDNLQFVISSTPSPVTNATPGTQQRQRKGATKRAAARQEQLFLQHQTQDLLVEKCVSPTPNKQIGIDSHGNKYVIIKTSQPDFLLQQQSTTVVAAQAPALQQNAGNFNLGSSVTLSSINEPKIPAPPQQLQKSKSSASVTGGRKHAGNTITVRPQQLYTAEELSIEAVPSPQPPPLTHTVANTRRRSLQPPPPRRLTTGAAETQGIGSQLLLAAANRRLSVTEAPPPAKMPRLTTTVSSGTFTGDDLTRASGQLLQLQQQRQKIATTSVTGVGSTAVGAGGHVLHNRKPKKQPQQHRNIAQKKLIESAAVAQQQAFVAAVTQAAQTQLLSQQQSVHSTTTTSGLGEEHLQLQMQQQQQLQMQMQPEEQIDGTSNILAVPTQPIPGYNETFLLCTLVNNNYKPIDNVPLYLDHDLNQLVPVPLEALDGNPTNLIVSQPPVEDHVQVQQPPPILQQHVVTNVADIALKPQMEADSSTQLICLQPTLINEAIDTTGATIIQQAAAIAAPTVLTTDGANVTGSMDIFMTQDGTGGEIVTDNAVILNIEGQQIILDAATFAHLLANPDATTQLITDDGTEFVLTREVLAALEAQNAEQLRQQIAAAQIETGAVVASGGGPTDILAVALAGAGDLYGAEVLEIETSQGAGALQLLGGTATATAADGSLIFHTTAPLPPAHLTPPITAQTSETNALLNQTPIMSTLEKPSSGSSAGGKCKSMGGAINGGNLLTTAASASCRPNLDDSLAVLGVATQSSTVPTSLELPITVTNPAIAPKVTMTAVPPAMHSELVQFQTHRSLLAGETTRLYNDPGS